MEICLVVDIQVVPGAAPIAPKVEGVACDDGASAGTAQLYRNCEGLMLFLGAKWPLYVLFFQSSKHSSVPPIKRYC